MNDQMQRPIYAVIMAGGIGSRFWPKSRERSPKQFMEIAGNGTMIQNTVTRLAPLVPKENIVVVTNEVHLNLIRQQIPDLPEENILTEPVGRNTAPCIGLAAHWIQRRNPSSTMIILPSDHLIRNTDEFLNVLGRGIRVANENRALVTIGIHPTHPETGYGYIQYDDTPDSNPYTADGVYRVRTFAEKPNLETAVQFIKSGDFAWNSGMFIWKSDVILEEIAAHLPELSEQLSHVAATMETPEYPKALELAFGVIRSISIDYGVMEKAAQVFVVRGDFGWSDVGSWDEVVRLTPGDNEGNSFRGNVISRDSRGNYIDAGDITVAAIGVDDLIVVSAGDAILICRKGKSQEVKEVVDYLRRKQMNELL